MCQYIREAKLEYPLLHTNKFYSKPLQRVPGADEDEKAKTSLTTINTCDSTLCCCVFVCTGRTEYDHDLLTAVDNLDRSLPLMRYLVPLVLFVDVAQDLYTHVLVPYLI